MLDVKKLRELASLLAPLQGVAENADKLNDISAAVATELRRAKAAAHEAQKALAELAETKKEAETLKNAAQETARKDLALSREASAKILADAEAKARGIVAAAERAAEALVQSAKTGFESLKASTAQAHKQRAALASDVAELEGRLAAARTALKKFSEI